MKKFPVLERLIHFYVWMTVFGGLLLAIALALGVVGRQWAAASALLGSGIVIAAGGLYGRRQGRRMVKRLRTNRDEDTSNIGIR